MNSEKVSDILVDIERNNLILHYYFSVRRVLAEGKRKVVSEEDELKAASGIMIIRILIQEHRKF